MSGGDGPGPFVYEALPVRVAFGPGRRRELASEMQRLGVSKALLIAGEHERETADEAARTLGPGVAGRWPEVRQHVPVELVDRARAEAARAGADALVCIGGGSAIGLAKAIALSLSVPIPIVALPTTYSGSEMTPIWGTTAQGHKTTGRDARVLPSAVIYDPELTTTLPVRLSATTGVNALAHCAEALYAAGANPVTSLVALEGARALFASLPLVTARPTDVGARSTALYGAFLAGRALAGAGTSVHHKVCHVLGGRYDLPHAELHTAVLAHSLALVEAQRPELLAPLAAATGAASAATGVAELIRGLIGSASVGDLGVTLDQLRAAVPDVLATGAGRPWANTEDEVTAFMESLLYA